MTHDDRVSALIADNDAWADAEDQLRHWRYGHIERKDEGWWIDLVYCLLEYFAAHFDYPTQDEFERLWKQEQQRQIEQMKNFLARTRAS
jgi:hypothetical protein